MKKINYLCFILLFYVKHMYLQRPHADDVYSSVSDSFCVVDTSLRATIYGKGVYYVLYFDNLNIKI